MSNQKRIIEKLRQQLRDMPYDDDRFVVWSDACSRLIHENRKYDLTESIRPSANLLSINWEQKKRRITLASFNIHTTALHIHSDKEGLVDEFVDNLTEEIDKWLDAHEERAKLITRFNVRDKHHHYLLVDISRGTDQILALRPQNHKTIASYDLQTDKVSLEKGLRINSINDWWAVRELYRLICGD